MKDWVKRTYNLAFRASFLYLGIPLFTAITFFLLGGVMYRSVADEFSKRLARQHSIEAAANFQKSMHGHFVLMNQISRSRTISRWLANEYNEHYKYYAFDEMMGFAIFAPEVRLMFTAYESLRGYYFDIGLTQEEFLPWGQLAGGTISQWFFDTRDSEECFIFNIQRLRPVNDDGYVLYVWSNHRLFYQGKFVGVVTVGSCFEQVFNNVFGGYNVNHIRGYIIDQYGAVRADSARTLAVTEFGLPTFPAIPERAYNPELDKAIENFLLMRAGLHYDVIYISPPVTIPISSGIYRYASITPIDGTAWSILVFSNHAEIYHTNFIILFVVISIILVAASLIGGRFVNYYALSPLSKLTESVTLAAESDTGNSFYGLNRNDEIGVLARTVQEMHHKIQIGMEASKRIQLMFDAAPLSIQYWTKDHMVIECNNNIVKEYGFTRKEEYITYMISRRNEFYAIKQGRLPNTNPGALVTTEYWFLLLDAAFENGYNSFKFADVLPNGSLQHTETTCIRMLYNNEPVVATYAKDITLLVEASKAHKHRENMANTVKDIAELLLNSELAFFQKHLKKSIQMIAEAAAVQRVYLWRNYKVKTEEKLYGSLELRWSKHEAVFNEKTSYSYSDMVPSWEDILKNGAYINTLVRNMPEKEQKHLSIVGILSVFLAPIFIKGDYWGFIGFYNYEKERLFTEDEQSILHSAALLIANAFILNEMIENLHKTSRQLEQASKAKSNFLAHMSHEIRTPLNAIIGMMTIGNRAETIEQKNDAFNKIRDASTHLLGIINDVLDISKIEADKFELTQVEFNFKKMLQKVLTLNNYHIKIKKLDLTVDTDINIPHILAGDDQRLAQVITNLLSNAVKFTPEGGKIHLKAFFLGEADGICELQISVTDSGIGMHPEDHERIFKAFEQAESGNNRNYGGTGLGLAISRRIIELMGGRLWVESDIGKGSRFVFTFKVKRSIGKNESMALSNVNAKEDDAISDEFSGKKMLVAEDVEINREIIAMFLEKTGIEIDYAENGLEAVDMVSMSPDKYDIIFMDMQMPKMDGLEATRRIRSLSTVKHEKLPIVATSANVFKESIEACSSAGMNDHISKPLDIDKVMEILRKHLG